MRKAGPLLKTAKGPVMGEAESSVWKVVTLNFASWNQLDGWLRRVGGLRRVA